MGLDNGVLIRRKDKQDIDWADFEKVDDWYELVYLRKFWPVRYDIVGNLGIDNGEIEIGRKDLEKIYDIIRYWIGRVALSGEEASTIWGPEEEMVILSRELEKIYGALCALEEDGEELYEMKFYDSY